jgi:hypothetical protein
MHPDLSSVDTESAALWLASPFLAVAWMVWCAWCALQDWRLSG